MVEMIESVPEIQNQLARISEQYGSDALSRVTELFAMSPAEARKRKHPLQKGAMYVLPGLGQNGWLDVGKYPRHAAAARALKTELAAIRSEYEQFFASGNYQRLLEYYCRDTHDVNEKWRAVYLWREGQPQREVLEHFPRTAQLLGELWAPDLYPLGEIIFSVLAPKGRVAPHCDRANFCIAEHYGVIIPESCFIRVAGETRQWTEGETLLFDNSFEHEVWNDSELPRVILLAEVWSPEVTAAEREALGWIFSWLHENAHRVE